MDPLVMYALGGFVALPVAKKLIATGKALIEEHAPDLSARAQGSLGGLFEMIIPGGAYFQEQQDEAKAQKAAEKAAKKAAADLGLVKKKAASAANSLKHRLSVTESKLRAASKEAAALKAAKKAADDRTAKEREKALLCMQNRGHDRETIRQLEAEIKRLSAYQQFSTMVASDGAPAGAPELFEAVNDSVVNGGEWPSADIYSPYMQFERAPSAFDQSPGGWDPVELMNGGVTDTQEEMW